MTSNGKAELRTVWQRSGGEEQDDEQYGKGEAWRGGASLRDAMDMLRNEGGCIAMD